MCKLDKDRLKWLTDKTNRGLWQTQFLYELVDGDFEKLKQLEMQLSNCLVNWCPGDKEAVDYVMSLEPKVKLLDLYEEG